MKILVTGGAGFIGSHIVDALLLRGHEVYVLDNYSSGRLDNIPPAARSVGADIRQVGDFVREFPVDAICHQAAQPSLRASLDDPAHDAMVNIVGTLNVIQAAKVCGAHVVFASTSAVYASVGAPYAWHPAFVSEVADTVMMRYGPLHEGSPLAPATPYGLAKLTAEKYLELSGVSRTILRYGNVYGPRQVQVGGKSAHPALPGASLGWQAVCYSRGRPADARFRVRGGYRAGERRSHRGQGAGHIQRGHGARHIGQRGLRGAGEPVRQAASVPARGSESGRCAARGTRQHTGARRAELDSTNAAHGRAARDGGMVEGAVMYDSTQDTIEHIRKAQARLDEVCHNLTVRAAHHDLSKLRPPEKAGYDQMTEQLRDLVYGSDEYTAALAANKPTIDHHYAANSHHPEHYENGIAGMSLLDIIEMVADWKAASERTKQGSIAASLVHNKKRFGISDQLASILENTVRELNW